jgi:hypothetical protein
MPAGAVVAMYMRVHKNLLFFRISMVCRQRLLTGSIFIIRRDRQVDMDQYNPLLGFWERAIRFMLTADSQEKWSYRDQEGQA